ncbi:nucleic-acid-binding protein from transposon X-element [Trichonephila clavipes]|nr:nucleic-acid-binding protein from transposon X-element [Trichonephila clavipes]
MFSNDHEERRSLIQYLKTDIDFEFYVIDFKKDKPIKAVIKGLPNSSKTEDITSDLADEGFKIESCTQLTSKRTKKPLPFFLVILPRNAHNSKIFDLTHLSYLQVRVEGYLVRGITQCFNCNNFFHTAANCHMQPRCLKCGKNHATRNCLIKDRKIHSALTAKTTVTRHATLNAPNSLSQKKEPLSQTPRKSEISPLNGLKREFPSLTLLAEKYPIRFLSMTKKIPSMDSLVKIVITPQT